MGPTAPIVGVRLVPGTEKFLWSAIREVGVKEAALGSDFLIFWRTLPRSCFLFNPRGLGDVMM